MWRRVLSSSRISDRSCCRRCDYTSSRSSYYYSTNASSKGGEEGIEASFEKCVTGKNVERLYRQGYAVFKAENGFDSNVGKELRKEIDALFLSSPERFVPNSTRFVKDGFQTELVKKNILELSAPFVEETDGRY